MSADLTFTRDLRHPPQRVWRALTDSALLADWLFPNDFRPVIGEAFTLSGPQQPDWNGVITATILAMDEPRYLSLRWQADAIKANAPLDTVVTFRLEPVGTGTRLRVDHTGFLPGQVRNRAGAETGWPRLLARLETTLDHPEGERICSPE